MESLSYTPLAEICLFVPRVGSFSYTSPVFESVCSFVEESLRHAPCWNQSRHLVVLESLLHAPSWNLSRRSAGGEFVLYARLSIMSGRSADLQGILHTPCWNVSARSADRESRLQSLNSPMPNSVRSFICNLSRRLVSRSLSQTPRAGVSVRSAGGEFLLYAP